MTPAVFLEKRKPIWDRVEELLIIAGKKGAKALSHKELQELTRLYPTIAVDVSKVKMYKLDAITMARVNDLAIRAHGMLYHRKKEKGGNGVVKFLIRDYPRLFRANLYYLLFALLLFCIPMISTYSIVRINPETAYTFMPNGLDVENSERVSAEDVSERYRQMSGSFMSASITTNNIRVALVAFALGISFCLGTCYILLSNSIMLGCFIGHFTNHGLSTELWHFLSPHGLLEIFAIIVAGASGLKLGMSILIPGELTRRDSIKKGALESVSYLLGTIPMFIVAGFIESYITPAYISGNVKILIGFAALGSFLAYLFFVGKGKPDPINENSLTA